MRRDRERLRGDLAKLGARARAELDDAKDRLRATATAHERAQREAAAAANAAAAARAEAADLRDRAAIAGAASDVRACIPL